LWLGKLLSAPVNLVSGLIITLAAIFTSGGKPLKAVRNLSLKNIYQTMAYAQNIILDGSGQNRMGVSLKRPWVGPKDATAQLKHRDIIRLSIHYIVAIYLVTTFIMIIYFI
jgi:hypothetical protein